jgi:hypothetical protein
MNISDVFGDLPTLETERLRLRPFVIDDTLELTIREILQFCQED